LPGCGASCIYPLLATTTNKWKILATEIDNESVDCARRNVARNGLEEFITGRHEQSFKFNVK
jgi:23S rRNA A1618 N6-methylase RlmF